MRMENVIFFIYKYLIEYFALNAGAEFLLKTNLPTVNKLPNSLFMDLKKLLSEYK